VRLARLATLGRIGAELAVPLPARFGAGVEMGSSPSRIDSDLGATVPGGWRVVSWPV
jgi:hypothetical protein